MAPFCIIADYSFSFFRSRLKMTHTATPDTPRIAKSIAAPEPLPLPNNDTNRVSEACPDMKGSKTLSISIPPDR